MQPTRREFMRQVGVTLAGLLLSGCDLTSHLIAPQAPTPDLYPTCYQPPAAAPMPTNTPTPAPADAERWRALRACWLDLQDSRLQSPEETEFPKDLRRRHADALKALVAGQELQADVADAISIAFEEAITHVERKMVTCYTPLQPGEANPYPSREELITQAAVLTEMAGRSDIDPDTVARARAVLARDMAWLSQFQTGMQPGELDTIETTPAEIEAARILVELLLAKK